MSSIPRPNPRGARALEQGLTATLRNLTCGAARRPDRRAAQALAHLRRTWVSPAHQRERAASTATAATDGAAHPPTPVQQRALEDALWTIIAHVAQGQLQPAADRLKQALASLKAAQPDANPDANPLLRMLETESELLQHELRLAASRGQLARLPVGALALDPLLNLVACLVPGGEPLSRDPTAARTPAGRRAHQPAAEQRLRGLQAAMALLHDELSRMQRREPLAPTRTASSDSTSDTAPAPTATPEAPPATASNAPPNPDWLQARAMSQLGQDLWVLERSGYKTGGFFLEFGATDGVLLSNTWLLEHHFGWHGLCAEPNPRFFPQLQANRTCGVSDQYIGGTTGETVEFLLADAYGGSTAHMNEDHNAIRRAGYDQAGRIQRMQTLSLHDFLRQHN